MRPALGIGDFSRATHLSIKTLRHYHRIGLLEPADVDPDSGHRRYTTDQIAQAQVIRRFRSLDMPLEEIQGVIAAPDLAERNELISAHLNRLEGTLARAQEATASLRDLLKPPAECAPVVIQQRQIAATSAIAVREMLDLEDAASWFHGALGELYGIVTAQQLNPTGHAGGIYANDLFNHGRGYATVYVPCDDSVRATGRVDAITVPAVELALITHRGPHHDVDRSYGALGTYVAEHALGIEGPIREFYTVGSRQTHDSAEWETEIGWPIFHVGA